METLTAATTSICNVDILRKVTLLEVKQIFEKWLYLEDKNLVDVELATIVANRLETEPAWLLITGPSGTAKTETLRALDTPETYQISTLTGQTLVSGFRKKGKDPSLLPHLDGKTLIVKDFTSVLSLHREERSKIFADLRDSYDGTFAKGFGNEAEVARYKSKFGLLGGVTPEIDRFHSVTNTLGERFLKYRPILVSRKNAIERARSNRGKEKTMREELKSAAAGFLNNFDEKRDITISDDMQQKIENLIEWMAILRTAVSRDGYTDEISYLPEIEVGTRLIKQMMSLGVSLAMIRDKTELTEDEFMILAKIARDTLPSKRMRLFEELFMKNDYQTTQAYSNATNLPTETCKLILDDFRLLGVADRQGSHEFTWKIKDNVYALTLKAGL